MPSPTPVGTSTPTVNSTAGTSCAPAIPTGLTNGQHWMVCAVSVNGNKTASMTNPPTGWTTVLAPALNSAGTSTLGVWKKLFATGDGAPSISWTTTNKNVGCIVAFKDADLTTPIDVTVTSGTGSSTTPTSPTATALTMGATRLHIHGTVINGTGTPSFDNVELVDSTTSATSPAALYMMYQAGMATGALGTRAATTSSGSWIAVTIWLRPAVPTPFGLLQSAKQTTNGTTVTTTLPAASTLGNLLTAELTCSTNTTFTIPNFTMNTAQNVTIETIQQGYRANAPATTSFVATRGSGTDNNSLLIKEWVGVATSSPLDTTGTGIGTTNGSTATITSGSTAGGNELAIATFSFDGSGGTSTFDASYTPRWDQNSTAISPLYSEDTYFTGGSTKSAVFTTSGTGTVGGTIMIFKAPAAGGASAVERRGPFVRAGSRSAA